MQSGKLALLAALACAGGLAFAAPPASAAAYVSISVGRPPPPLRYEPVPPPRVGYVWAPGYWRWSHGRYVWVSGVWHHSRPGYVYYGPRWEPSHGHWVYHDSYWGNDPHWHHDNGHHNGWDKHGHHDHDHDNDWDH
jgi:hypothetical protein